MSKSQFWALFVLVNVSFVFLKIYQHNIYLNTLYERQKLELTKKDICLEINKLKKELYTLKNKQKLSLYANEELGMSTIKMSQISSLEHNAA